MIRIPTVEFTRHEQTDATGPIYMQARFYLSMWGRFASPDPVRDQHFEDAQSWNIYSYVQNNPIMKIDPNGEYAVETTSGNNVKILYPVQYKLGGSFSAENVARFESALKAEYSRQIGKYNVSIDIVHERVNGKTNWIGFADGEGTSRVDSGKNQSTNTVIYDRDATGHTNDNKLVGVHEATHNMGADEGFDTGARPVVKDGRQVQPPKEGRTWNDIMVRTWSNKQEKPRVTEKTISEIIDGNNKDVDHRR